MLEGVPVRFMVAPLLEGRSGMKIVIRSVRNFAKLKIGVSPILNWLCASEYYEGSCGFVTCLVTRRNQFSF